MQRCDKCGVTIRGAKRKCPLCGGVLSGTPEAETAAYPTIQNKLSKWSVVKVAAFCLAAVELIMLLLRYITHGSLLWPLAVMIWAPIGFLDLLIAFYYRHNVLKLLSWQVYIGMAISIIIDRRMAGWHAWSISWLLPCGFVGLAVATVCIGIGTHRMLTEYIIYLAAAVVLSLGQMIFIRIGWNPLPLPALISMAAMLLLGVAGLLFFFRELRSAAARTFHM